MTWVAVAGVAGAAITAGTSIYSSRQAARNGQQSSTLADPFSGDRPRYAQRLSEQWEQLTSNRPQDTFSDPTYQGMQMASQGANAASMAANGMSNSGTNAAESGRIGAANYLAANNARWTRNQNILGMLGSFSGATTGNPGAAGQLYGYGASAGLNYLNQGVGSTIGALQRVPWQNLGFGGNGGTGIPGSGSYPGNPGSGID